MQAFRSMASNQLQQPLGALKVQQLHGNEPFHMDGNATGHCVTSFWGWAYSNLAANNLRGHLAEFLVASDLGLTLGTRVEWDDCDLTLPTGTRIEVKCAAYLQSWRQKQLSNITFSIAPSCAWDRRLQARSQVATRNSDLYVFCLLNHKDKSTLDPTNLNQWEFFVVPTALINDELGNQKTLTLSALKKLTPRSCRFGEISKSVSDVLAQRESVRSRKVVGDKTSTETTAETSALD